MRNSFFPWIVFFLIGALLPRVNGQSAHYFTENGPLSLSGAHASRVVYSPANPVFYPSGIPGVPAPNRVSVRVFGTYTAMVVEFDQELDPAQEQRIDSACAAHFPLFSASHGWLIDGHLKVWLTHHVAYKPSAAFDSAVFKSLLLAFPGSYFDPTPTGIQRIWTPDIDQVVPLANVMHQSGMFAWSQPDFSVEAMRMSDPLFPDQYYLDNQGQNVLGPSTSGIDIDAPLAWMITTGSPTLKVAVVDEGVEAHEDLQDAMGVSRLLPGYSTFSAFANGNPVTATEFHGQPCAGIIAASHNTIGGRGVAPQVKILPVAFPYVVTTPASELADALNWAWMNGADVISNAWGIPTCLAAPFATLVQAVNDAETFGRFGQGAVTVFAAGNSGLPCVFFPSNMANTLSAGAVDQTGVRPAYGNHGTLLDIVSPTAGSVDNVHVMDRMGVAGINVDGTGDLPDPNYSYKFGGTSTATSTVSGVAALLLSEAPWLSAADVRTMIRVSATDIGDPGFDTLYGYGLLNAYQALLEIGPLSAGQLDLSARYEEGAVKLTWNKWPAATGNEQFFVEARENGRFQPLDLPVAATAEGFLARDYWPAGPSRTYRLRLLTSEGKTHYSDEVEVLLPSSDRRMTVWWDEASAELKIRTNESGMLSLFTLEGREVANGLSGGSIISLPGLPAGVYLLRATFADGTSLNRKIWIP